MNEQRSKLEQNIKAVTVGALTTLILTSVNTPSAMAGYSNDSYNSRHNRDERREDRSEQYRRDRNNNRDRNNPGDFFENRRKVQVFCYRPVRGDHYNNHLRMDLEFRNFRLLQRSDYLYEEFRQEIRALKEVAENLDCIGNNSYNLIEHPATVVLRDGYALIFTIVNGNIYLEVYKIAF